MVDLRSHAALEAREGSWDEPPGTQGQGQQLGGATRGAVAVRAQEGLEEPSHVEGQEGQWEEIRLNQGKQEWLCFTGATA